MATFVPNLTDDPNSLHTERYSPDWGFLSANMQKKETQYIQGQQQVASDYSAILNAPITNEENKVVKQDYLKTIQEGLKKVATTDLSLPKNVTQAENLYAPFWQDNELLTDISLTKKYTTQMQKARSVEFSKDEDVRKTFDSRSTELLQYQLHNLRTSKRSEVGSVEMDDWTPFANVDNHLEDKKIADNYAVVQSFTTIDGHVVTTTNGSSTLPAFKNYADAHIGTEFNNQYKVLGKLSKEKQIAGYIQTHPGATRQDALNDIAAPLYESYMKDLSNSKRDYDYQIGMSTAELEKLKSVVAKQPGNAPDPTQEYNIARLTNEIQELSGRKTYIEKTYQEMSKADGIKGIAINPENYIGQIYRNEDIRKWAIASAGKSSVKIDTDQAFWNKKTLDKEYYSIGITDRHNQAEERIQGQNANTNQYNAETNRLDLKGKYPYLFNADGSVNNQGTGDWRYAGNATTENQQIDPITEANIKKQELHDAAYQGIYSPNGLVSILRNMPTDITAGNPSNVEVLAFADRMNKHFTGKPIGNSPTEEAAYKKMSGFLFLATGLPTDNYENTNKAMLAYVAKYVKTHTVNGAMDSKESSTIQQTYSGIKNAITAYDDDDAQRSANINNVINSTEGKQFKNLVIEQPNGQKRLVNKNDIAGRLSDVQLVETTAFPVSTMLSPDDSRIVHMKAGDLADFFDKGKLNNVKDGSWGWGEKDVVIEGKKYRVVAVKDRQGNIIRDQGSFTPDPNMAWMDRQNTSGKKQNSASIAFRNMMNGVEEKFGRSEDFVKKKTELEKKAVFGTSLYKSNDGIIGPQIAIPNINPDAPLTKALREDVLPGQFNAMYNRNDDNAHLSGEEIKAVQEAINDPKISDYIGAEHMYYPRSFTGKPGVEIRFNTLTESDTKKIPDNIKKLSGKTIFIEHSDTHGGTFNKLYPKTVDYSWHPLSKEGGVVKSDPVQDATNHASYEIIHSQGQAVVTGQWKSIDPHTGKENVHILQLPPAILGEQDPVKVVQSTKNIVEEAGRRYNQNLEYFRTHSKKQ